MSSKGRGKGRKKKSVDDNVTVKKEIIQGDESDTDIPDEVLENSDSSDDDSSSNATISTVSSFDDISDQEIDIEDVKEEEEDDDLSKTELEETKTTLTDLELSSSKLELIEEEENILEETEFKKVPNDERSYSESITKYEFVNVLMQRTQQLNKGAPPLITPPVGDDITKELIALLEIASKKSPLIIRRWSSNRKHFEDWKLSELNFDSIQVYLNKHIPKKYQNIKY